MLTVILGAGLALFAAGGIGGVIGTLINTPSVPLPKEWQAWCPAGSMRAFLARLGVNIVCGGCAALALWLSYAPLTSSAAGDIDPRYIGGSFLVGLTGARILAGWARQSQELQNTNALARSV